MLLVGTQVRRYSFCSIAENLWFLGDRVCCFNSYTFWNTQIEQRGF